MSDMSNLPLVRFFAPDFGELPRQFAFAKLSIILVLFASVILENLDLTVYVRESVCIRLIVHGVSPLIRILRLVRSQNRDFKVLAEGRTIIDGGAASCAFPKLISPACRVWALHAITKR